MELYQELETRFAEWVGRPVACTVVCSSGTTALHLALEAFELRLGSHVLIPEYTMVACARAVTLAGHAPIPVDCFADNLLIDTRKLKKHIDGKTCAVMAVHVYGRQCDMESIHKFAKRHELFVIEDLAEGHGITPHDKTDAACYSFYCNKIIHGEEGGMIVFRNPDHARLARLLRNMGFPADQSYEHSPRGINGRMSNAHARLILDSLALFNENMTARKQVEQWYNEAILGMYHMPARNVPWVYDIRLKGIPTASVVQQLQSQGIMARHGFKPISQQQEYARPWKHLKAFQSSLEIIYLPITPDISPTRVRITTNELVSAIEKSTI